MVNSAKASPNLLCTAVLHSPRSPPIRTAAFTAEKQFGKSELTAVGIAMGALGSDAAIEAADVVLMDDNPVKIGKAIKVSRKTMKIVMENIVFALAVKL